MTLEQLQEERKKALGLAENYRQKYTGKPGEMNSEEEAAWEKALADADHYEKMIDRLSREEKSKEWGKKLADTIIPFDGTQSGDGTMQGKTNPNDVGKDGGAKAELHMQAFRKALRSVTNTAFSAAELYALQADNPAGGGFLLTPQMFVEQLIANIKDLVFIRQMATVYTTDKADGLGVPSLDTDVDDPDWTQEIGTIAADTGLAFGKRELKAQALTKLVKISKTLLRQNAIDTASVVMDRLAYKFGIAEEKAFLSGTGANQPLGVFTASADGIPTSQDTTAANANSIVADDLINVKHDVKLQYWKNGAWVFGRPVLKAVRKLKDSNNNYIWATGLGPGQGFQGNAGTLLDSPYYVSEYAPSTITTGLYTAIFGDFSKYWIADALDMQVQVLDQLYAVTNQNGYIARKETDGMPVLAEAFRRLKQA